jgi:hypothetical protein
MGLLLACKESRDVFLKVFKNTLSAPTRNGRFQGKVRFEDDTMIRLHYGRFYDTEFVQAMQDRYSVSCSFDEVQKLAFDDLAEDEDGPVVLAVSAAFKNLKSMGLVSVGCMDKTEKQSAIDKAKKQMTDGKQLLGEDRIIPDIELLFPDDIEHVDNCACTIV